MKTTFRYTAASAVLAIAAVACISTTASAQEGQQYNCAPGTVLRYDECEPTTVPTPASQAPQRQKQRSHATALAAHPTDVPARARKPQTTPPKLAKHVSATAFSGRLDQ
jgi:hypothetical protein